MGLFLQTLVLKKNILYKGIMHTIDKSKKGKVFMNNKYVILALLPIIFHINIYADTVICPDLDMLIKNELQAAQIVMNKPVKLELQPVLDALVLFAGKSKNNRTIGIESILLIQKSVNQCKSQQYTTWSSFTSLFGFHPELVTREIQPALKAIDSSLKILNVSQGEISTASKVIGTVAVGLALTGVVIGGAVWWATGGANSRLDAELLAAMNNYPHDFDYSITGIAVFWSLLLAQKLTDKDDGSEYHNIDIYRAVYTYCMNELYQISRRGINLQAYVLGSDSLSLKTEVIEVARKSYLEKMQADYKEGFDENANSSANE